MKQRVNTLLEPETIEALNKEAKEKSISVSAVIRQKVEASYKSDPKLGLQTIKGDELTAIVNRNNSRNRGEESKPCDHVFNRAKGVTYTKCFKCGGEI